MPNSYTGPAREGVYAPFRLSETSQEWKSSSDIVMHFPSLGTPSSSTAMGFNFPVASSGPAFPYGLDTPWYNGSSVLSIQPVNKRSDTNVIHIAFRQLAKDASLMFHYRAGWEYQVLPGTTLVSFARSSPQYDPLAIQTYF